MADPVDEGASNGGAPHVPRAIILEREAHVTKFYRDPQKVSEFEDEARRAWEDLDPAARRRRLDVIWCSLGPSVYAEMECAPEEVKGDPEKLLERVIIKFGEHRDPDKLLKQLFSQTHSVASQPAVGDAPLRRSL